MVATDQEGWCQESELASLFLSCSHQQALACAFDGWGQRETVNAPKII